MEYLIVVLSALGLVIQSIISGCFVVYAFNHIPINWTVDVGQKPDVNHRILASVNFKYILPALFIMATFGMWQQRGIAFAIAGGIYLIPIYLVAITDYYYKVIHEKLVAIVILGSLTLIPFLDFVYSKIWVSLVLAAIIEVVSYLIYRQMAFGGGDVLLLIAINIGLGAEGVVLVFVMAIFFSAFHYFFIQMSKMSDGKTDTGRFGRKTLYEIEVNGEKKLFLPFGPYLAIGVTLFLMFFTKVPLYDIIIGVA